MAYGENSAINKAWEYIIEKFNIEHRVLKGEAVPLSANDLNDTKKVIKDVKGSIDARLMAKFDSSSILPASFKKLNLDIIPTSRGKYLVSDFLMYEKVPNLEDIDEIKEMNIQYLETLNIKNITSENSAILATSVSGILEDFLKTDKNIYTINSRMGSGDFSFKINRLKNSPIIVNVSKCQIEIDGGFENSNSIVLIEAKSVLNEDFNVRQLYYPLRTWANKVKKPIRNIFMIYVNKVFYLFEYTFDDLENFSSIRLINSKAYILNQTRLSLNSLLKIHKTTNPTINDKEDSSKIPFPQADSFYRIISLMENMYENPMNAKEIAELMNFGHNINKEGKAVYRQSAYYTAAGQYIGVFKKEKGKVRLSEIGKKIVEMNFEDRIIEFSKLLFSHQIFSETFEYIKTHIGIKTYCISKDKQWDKIREEVRDFVINRMDELEILKGEPMKRRRSQTVLSWLKWLTKQINFD